MNFLIFSLISLIIFGFRFPRSKIVLSFQTIFACIIIGGYNGIGDLDNYQLKYKLGTINEGYTEILYDYVAFFFHSLGFKFETFHLFVSTVSILIIVYVVSKISKEPSFTMSLMYGFTLLEFALQIKALIATAIIAYALYYYFKNSNTRKPITILVYLILVFLATGFHFMSLFFVLFVFKDILNTKIVKIFSPFIIILIFFLLPFIINYLSFYVNALNYYNGNYRQLITFLSFCVWHLIGFLITINNANLVSSLTNESKILSYIDFIKFGSNILLLILPFYSLTSIANRYVRVWSIFFYSTISYIPTKKNYIHFHRLLMVFYSLSSFILFYILFQEFNNDSYNVLTDILKNNILWKFD